MIRKIQKKLNNRKGFTLVELIVVIVILGILSAILVPSFTVYIQRANQASDDATIANIKTAVIVAYLDSKVDAGASQKINADGTYDAVTTSAQIQTVVNALYTDLTFKYYSAVTISVDANGAVTGSGAV